LSFPKESASFVCHSRRESAVAFAFWFVIPEGNLLLSSPFWFVIPEGNLQLPLPFWFVIPEGNLRSSGTPSRKPLRAVPGTCSELH
jgi:hypothetical protein